MKKNLSQMLTPTSPLVNILMCTYNGERFLEEQLDSILQQDYKNIKLWVSDDGSTDNTLSILKKYQKMLGMQNLIILSGPKQGSFIANFFSFFSYKEINGEYFAFSDQDDIWERDKISRAVSKLSDMQNKLPLLYCSRTSLLYQNKNKIGYTTKYRMKPSFANAIVQSIASGNTFVFNKKAFEKVAQYSKGIEVIYHDWWVYIVVTGVGGEAFFDNYPGLRYRQHNNNQVGAKEKFFARVKHLINRRFKKWTDVNVAAIKHLEAELTPENKYIYNTFIEARGNKFLFCRINGIIKSGVYRLSFIDNLGLVAGVLFNRI